MISRAFDLVMARRMLPHVTSVFFLLLILAPETKLRLRDPAASQAGNLDLQTLAELGVYALIGLWAAWHLLRGWSSERYRLQTLGPAGLTLLAVTVLVVATGTLAVSSRSLIRSVQFGILFVVGMLTWWESRHDAAFFTTFWRWLRRGFVVYALAATALTAVVPSFDGSVNDAGIPRFGWLEIHPIDTAGLLGVTVLALIGMYLGLPERFVRRRWVQIASVGVVAMSLGLMVLTRSRGPTIAAAAGVLVLIALTPRRLHRKVALVMTAVIVAAALAYFSSATGASQLEGFVNRGQTTEQILSLSQRTELFEIGMGYVAERPIFGHGYLIPGTLLSTHYVWAGHAHNLVLEIIMALGIVGLLIFTALVAIVIRGLVLGLRSRHGRQTGLPAEGAALLALLLVQGVISDSFGGPVGWEVGSLMLCVLISDLGRRWFRNPEAGEPAASTDVAASVATSRTFGPRSPAPRLSRSGHGIETDEKVDLNIASIAELKTLPGVGARIAGRIHVYRAQHGRFDSVDQLIEVRGIGRMVLARIRPLVTVARDENRLRLRRW